MEWVCVVADVGAMLPHSCGVSCLGPLTFHCQVFGDKVSLSQGSRLARRAGLTFKNGLVFSSRPVGVQERFCLKVVTTSSAWHGALRVGFTNVHPAARGLPLAPMAIPNLSQEPGHWAAAVPESCCAVGAELKFWVSSGGKMFLCVNNSNNSRRILEGVDVSRPLWAMIDVYGQTSTIFLLGELTMLLLQPVFLVLVSGYLQDVSLLKQSQTCLTSLLFGAGSEKRGWRGLKRSCPAPQLIAPPDVDHSRVSADRSPCEDTSHHRLSLPASKSQRPRALSVRATKTRL